MPKTNKTGYADAGAVIRGAMRALHPDHDPYTKIQLALDALVGSPDPAQLSAAVRDVQLMLASVAASPGFDLRRHRAISQALRELARTKPATGPVAALTTRGAR